MWSSKCGLFGQCAIALALALSPTVAAAQTGNGEPLSSGPLAGGVFTITYEDGTDEKSKAFAANLRELAMYEEVASGITELFKLPNDLKGVFRNCGEVNAFYDPAKREVIICYELIAMLEDTALRNTQDPVHKEQFIMAGTFFFFLHEMGHALVDQLDLPITGKEEDVVDELAAMILLEDDEDGTGGEMLAMAAFQFKDMAATRQSMADLVFWDEHSLDAQRMYGLLCMIYGANPEANAEMVGDHALPQARAAQCPADYQKRKRAWVRLLESSYKPPVAESPGQAPATN